MTDIYQTTRNKEKTIAELKTATKALVENNIDMIICEVRSKPCYVSKTKQIRNSTLYYLVFSKCRRNRMGHRTCKILGQKTCRRYHLCWS